MSQFDLLDSASALRLGQPTGGAAQAAPPLSPPQPQQASADGGGPYLLFCDCFHFPRRVYATHAEAKAEAARLAKSTPGFVYFILAPIDAVIIPAFGPESRAAFVAEKGGQA